MSNRNEAVQRFQEMQRTIIAGITEKRLAQLDAVSDLDAINGVDNYEESLLEVITHHNETPIKGYETKGIHAGITAARLQLVFPDRMLFTKAKKALIAQGKIIERECGQTVVLNLKVNVEPTAPSPVGS